MKQRKTDLEDDVKQALSPVRAPRQFREGLKYKLTDAQQVRRPRRSLFVGWMAVAAALLVSLGYLLWPDFHSPATLPPLASTGPEIQGASGGPGFAVELEYSLGQNLGTLPREVTAYWYAPFGVSAETVQEVAAGLGVSGEVVTEAWQDGVIQRIGDDETGMVMGFPQGYYSYLAPVPAEPGRHSKADVLEAALAFLPKIGVQPEEVRLQSIVLPEEEGYYQASVRFVRKDIDNQVSIAPFVNVVLAADNTVTSAGWIWPRDLAGTSQYPTRALEAAVDDLLAGNGVLVIDYHQLPFPVGEVLPGQGYIESVEVGYVLTYADDGQVALQPVAAFQGTAEFADGSQFPFTVYTEIVEGQYYGR
ncbi:MAG: hypothetical protein ACOX18_03075 [Bacillota bacterium]|jgi:hypothetical protein